MSKKYMDAARPVVLGHIARPDLWAHPLAMQVAIFNTRQQQLQFIAASVVTPSVPTARYMSDGTTLLSSGTALWSNG